MDSPHTQRFDRPIMLAAWLWLAAATIFLAVEAITASAFPGYSYAANFISDLGVPYRGWFMGRELNSSLAPLMNFAGFAIHGILFATAVLVMLPSLNPRNSVRIALTALALAHAAGSVLIAVVHGGNREWESGIFTFHFIGACLTILGGNLAVLLLTGNMRRIVGARPYRFTSFALVGLALLGISLLLLFPASPVKGVFERFCVYSIMAWELLTAAYILLAAYAPSGAGDFRHAYR